jgi:hypothetical protein
LTYDARRLNPPAVALCAFLLGLTERHVAQNHEIGSLPALALSFAFVALVFFWYRADARARQYRISKRMSVAMVALTVIALPVYLLRSRRPRQRFVSIGLLVLAYVGAMICYRVASTVGVGA